MAKTYHLASEPRQFTPRPTAGVITVERDEDDNINFHRVIGTEMAWSDIDERGKPFGRRTGIVRAIQRGTTLIECANGEWFEESPRGIHGLDDRLRCEICASFICNCQSTHPNLSTMNPVPFKDLASYTQKQLIPCVEGRIKYLTEPRDYDGKLVQYGTLSEIGTNLEIGLKFQEDWCQPTDSKGKTIRLQCKDSGKGLTGVYMMISEKDGKEKRTVRTTSTVIVTHPTPGDMTANAPQTAPAASQAPSATQTPPARQNTPQAVSEQSRGYPASDSTVEQRVGAWLQIAEEVCRQISKPFEAFMEGLSSTDIKEITTGISMSYKGQYGVYAPPVFGGGEFSNRSVDSLVAQHAPNAMLVPSWKDFTYTKRDKNGNPVGDPIRLGDVEESRFLKLSEWAYKTQLDPSNLEAVRLQANVRMGTVEKKIARNVFLSLFAQAPGYGTEFDEQDLETVCGEQQGKASANLSAGEWDSSLGQFNEIIADCKVAHSNVDEDSIPF